MDMQERRGKVAKPFFFPSTIDTDALKEIYVPAVTFTSLKGNPHSWETLHSKYINLELNKITGSDIGKRRNPHYTAQNAKPSLRPLFNQIGFHYWGIDFSF
jgi:hypothetical protein